MIAILALKVIAGHDVSAVEFDLSLGEAIVGEKSDDAGDGDGEADGVNPIVILVGFHVFLQDSEFEPGRKVVIVEMAVFDGDHFCEVLCEELEGAARGDDPDGEVKPIEYQHPSSERRM